MEFDFSRLMGRIREKHESQRSLAAALGMDKSTFNLKINNRYEFMPSEILRICDRLDIPHSQIPQYFFCLKAKKKEAAPKDGSI